MDSRERLQRALSSIADPAGEGPRAFTKIYPDNARAEADRARTARSPIAGWCVSVKDLFDVAGDVTRAGSRVLADAPPAHADATAVARLRAAGAVIVGRTNMVEFAFGVVGANPHYGTPANPFDRAARRVPGGSSSGAAVAVADGMCDVALGTDTRGSIRIPAALCGIVGFKPTARRVPRDGAFPLSYTLDSVGPLAKTVADCAACDAVLAGEREAVFRIVPASALRLMVPQSSVLDDLDAAVAKAFANALSALSNAGATVVEVPMPMFDRQDEYFRAGGFAGAEAYAIHKPRFDRLNEYDPRVGKRIVLGEQVTLDAYAKLIELRAQFIRDVDAAATGFDAILMPTTPCTAPTIAEATASDDAYFRWNARLLRNAGLVNFLDGCAVSLPCHAPGTAPVGVSVCGVAMRDRHILAVAAAIETILVA
jgi:aspartyl-tRNA(Asn)/glutamyl-tRNA(Gln) amidotransferase subunit A